MSFMVLKFFLPPHWKVKSCVFVNIVSVLPPLSGFCFASKFMMRIIPGQAISHTQCISHKSHNATGKYPKMHDFVTEMCICVHISVSNQVVHCGIWDWSFVWFVRRFRFSGLFISRQCLTHWRSNKMASIWQTSLSNAFSWMKMFNFQIQFHWDLFLRVSNLWGVNICTVNGLVLLGKKPLLEPMLTQVPWRHMLSPAADILIEPMISLYTKTVYLSLGTPTPVPFLAHGRLYR